MIDPRQTLKQPLITEKSSGIKESGWYVFSVDKKANKKEIKDAVERVFNVKVDKVRTLIIPGRVVKRFGRPVGRRSPLKKAYIKLKEGKIEFFEGV